MNGRAVDRVAIPEKVLLVSVPSGEGLDELSHGSAGRGRIRDVEMDEFAPVKARGVAEDEEQAEGEGRDHEEVDGDELSGVRGEEGAPRGRRPRRRPMQVHSW